MKLLRYVRVSDANDAWLRAAAGVAGLPVTVVLDAVVTHARESGWQPVRPAAPRIEETR